jgi:MYXO-CTERM domain-containing protein
VNEATKTIDPFAFASMLIYGLDHDDAGNVFAHGAVIGLQRSHDSGATWTKLTVPVRNQYAQWIVNYGSGYLTVIGSDGMVYYSQNAGDSFQSAALPAGTLVDFANFGPTFYAVMNDGTLRVSTSAGASWSQVTVPTGTARAVEALAGGDVVISAAPVEYDVGLAYRSKDAGQSWVRERGAHNDARMEFAFGKTNQAMMVTTRGIFRYSTGPLLDLGVAPPPPGSGVDGGTGGAGVTGAGGSTGGSAGSSAGATGGTAGGSSGGGGCGCQVSASDTAPVGGALGVLAFALLRRRRRPIDD